MHRRTRYLQRLRAQGKKSVCLQIDETVIAEIDAEAAPGENRSQAVQRLVMAALGMDQHSDLKELVLKT